MDSICLHEIHSGDDNSWNQIQCEKDSLGRYGEEVCYRKCDFERFRACEVCKVH